MKRLVTIALTVFAIGAPKAEVRGESVLEKVLEMCSKNRTNREMCDYVAIESNILNLCFLRRDGELVLQGFTTRSLNSSIYK